LFSVGVNTNYSSCSNTSYFLGNETYGIWLLLNAGYIILQTLDNGQQAYIGNEFNIKFFSNKDELKTVLASSLRMAFIIGIIH